MFDFRIFFSVMLVRIYMLTISAILDRQFVRDKKVSRVFWCAFEFFYYSKKWIMETVLTR